MNDQMPVKLKPKENQRVEEMKALEKSKYPPVIILFSGIIWVFWRFTWLDPARKRKSLPGFGKDERNSGSVKRRPSVSFFEQIAVRPGSG